MNRVAALRVMTAAVANVNRLRGCPCHSFTVDMTPTVKLGKRWACEHCRGEVSTASKYWYEQGRRHGSTPEFSGRPQ